MTKPVFIPFYSAQQVLLCCSS